MTSRLLWAACVLACLATLGGCSKVESCKERDDGCLNGPPVAGKCKYDLLPTADGMTCVKKEDVGMGGSSDAGTPDSGPTTNPCGCASGQLCRADGHCSDPCGALSGLPGELPVLPPCRPTADDQAYDFATAAVSLCYQVCTHRADYCGGACDPTTECSKALAMTAALTVCPGMAVECAEVACEMARDTACANQKCANNAAPNCAGVVCSNTCSTADFNFDGECDDGDLSNASSQACGWGSDCGDCGPRRGTPPSFTLQLGDPCVAPSECGGNLNSVPASTGWCLTTDADTTHPRCLPDCSGSKACPSGFTCHDLVLTDSGDDVMDPQGNKASACFPNACGG